MSTTRRLVGTALLAVATLLPVVAVASTAGAADAPPGKLLLMLDASGSMNGPDPSGSTKLAAAQQALTSVVDGLPDAAVVGLRVYGATVNVPQPTPQSCADSQLIAPVAPLDRTGLKAAVASFKAVGDTPIAYALGEGIKDLGGTGKRNIVLVSDGQENCVSDPCPAVQQLVASGVDLQIDTVGFGVDDTARKQLQCIAGAGRGSYYDATDARQLSASLTKLSQRALRPFTLSGTPVRAAATPEAGPVLLPGQYTDSFEKGAPERYYRLTRTRGSTLRISATSRPPGKSWSVFEQVALTVRTPGGTTCGSDTPTRVDTTGKGLAVVAAVMVRGDQPRYSSPDCSTSTDLVVALSRPEGTDGVQPMEVVVTQEAPVTDVASLPAAARAADTAELLAPAAQTAPRIVGGGSFSDALAVTPGTYTDTVLPGEQVFYKVRLDFGQRLAVTVDAPSPGQALDLGSFATVYLAVDTWSPDRFALSRNSGEPQPTGLLMQRTLNLVLGQYTAPVRYRNRDAEPVEPLSTQRTSIAGDYYVAIGRSPARADEPKEAVPLDVRVRIAVVGQPSGQPAYATSGVTGLDATPSVTATTSATGTASGTATRTPPVLAADQQAADGSRPSSVVWAVIGVVLLFAAGVVGGILWRRRSSTGGGQPGGGSQA